MQCLSRSCDRTNVALIDGAGTAVLRVTSPVGGLTSSMLEVNAKHDT